MAVLINRKICDNAQECGGISECPNGAIYWSDSAASIELNNDLCVSCGICENACPVGAIRIAYSQDEYERINKEIEADQRTAEELFVDRYGAMPMDDDMLIDADDFNSSVEIFTGLTLVEFFSDDSIQCLAHSTPINRVLSWFAQCPHYYKVCSNQQLNDNYGITELPAIVLFDGAKPIRKYCGIVEVYPEREDYSQETQMRSALTSPEK